MVGTGYHQSYRSLRCLRLVLYYELLALSLLQYAHFCLLPTSSPKMAILLAFAGLSIFPAIFLASVVAKLSFWVGFLFYRSFKDDSIPGPWLAKYSRFWLARVLASGDSSKIFADTNLQYGSIARIAPNKVLVDDPNTIRQVLGTGSKYVRAPWFDTLRVNPHMTTVVSERDPSKHKHLRYKLSAGFSGRGVEDAEPIVDHFLQNWIAQISEQWASEPGTTKPFNIGRRIEYLTVDIISRICLGKEFGCVESDEDKFGFLQAVEVGTKASLPTSIFQELQTFYQLLTRIPLFHRLIVPSKCDKSGVGRVMGAIHKSIDLRQSSPPDLRSKGAMVDYLFKRGFEPEEIGEELLLALVAGSETTATSVQATLLEIILNPYVYGKLRAEIDEAIRSGAVSSPIKDAESRQLPYLQACIREGIRRFPPISQLRERIVPDGGDMVLGYHLPAGTAVGLNNLGSQLSGVFGPDPDIFRPERWLNASPEHFQAMRQTQELVFGYGETRCLGMPLAILELNKVFFEVRSLFLKVSRHAFAKGVRQMFRHFDISTTNPFQPWKSACWGLFFQQDFKVRVSRRATAS